MANKNFDLIPSTHRCKVCNKSKYEVGFATSQTVRGMYIPATCSSCKWKRVKELGNNIKLKMYKDMPYREWLSLQFKEYFERKTYARD